MMDKGKLLPCIDDRWDVPYVGELLTMRKDFQGAIGVV